MDKISRNIANGLEPALFLYALHMNMQSELFKAHTTNANTTSTLLTKSFISTCTSVALGSATVNGIKHLMGKKLPTGHGTAGPSGHAFIAGYTLFSSFSAASAPYRSDRRVWISLAATVAICAGQYFGNRNDLIDLTSGFALGILTGVGEKLCRKYIERNQATPGTYNYED